MFIGWESYMKLLVVVLTAILLCCGCYSTFKAYKSSVAIDFYQQWSVGSAMKESNGTLSSPYPDIEIYSDILDRSAAASGVTQLHTVNSINHQLYPYGLITVSTPLMYFLYALLPQDYLYAYHTFIALRLVLFAAVIGLMYRYDKLNVLTLALGILITVFHQSLYCDFRLGNVNTFQLFAIGSAVFFLDYRLCNYRDNQKFIPCTIFLCSLALFVLVKPNTLLVALALALSLFIKSDRKIFARSALVTVGFSCILILIPCFYFKSLAVWQDWSDFIKRGGETLYYNVFFGNFSTVLIVSKMLGVSINQTIVAISLIIVATFLCAIVLSKSSAKNTIVALLGNTNVSVALAVSMTLALSPLVWWYYYVLSLYSALWMINRDSRYSIVRIMGFLSLFLSSGAVSLIDPSLYLYNCYVTAASWIPLWFGSLVMIVRMIDDNDQAFQPECGMSQQMIHEG